MCWDISLHTNLEIVKNAAKLHEKFGDYIVEYAKISSKTGEPIVRHMEYEFPNQGFEQVIDQYMLGSKFMVAPVVTTENRRSIKLPKGKWKDDLGKIQQGGKTIEVDVPLNRIPYFEKIN